MNALLQEILKCQLCPLPHKANPILMASEKSKIAIIGQAPGRIVHETGIPWNDKSGSRLRDWLGVSNSQFYNPDIFALIPMGFCYPGKDKNGDLPPRKECAPLWHEKLLKMINKLDLIVLIGKYAQDYYLGKETKKNLTETVINFEEYLPKFMVLPHPSPRNNIWLKRNGWFEELVVPQLKEKVQFVLK